MRLLDRADGFRAGLQDLGGDLPGLGERTALGRYVVDEAEPERLAGGEPPARHQHFQRQGFRDAARQAKHAAAVGNEADLYLWKEELGVPHGRGELTA